MRILKIIQEKREKRKRGKDDNERREKSRRREKKPGISTRALNVQLGQAGCVAVRERPDPSERVFKAVTRYAIYTLHT